MNHLIHGLNDVSHDLAGYTLAQAEQALTEVLNIGPGTPAYVGGGIVPDKEKCVLRSGQAVVFRRAWGWKGAGRRRLVEDEVVELQDRVAILEQAIFGSTITAEVPGVTGTNGSHASLPMPKYLNAAQAATYLGITLQALYGKVARGELKPLKAKRAGKRQHYWFTTALLDDYRHGR